MAEPIIVDHPLVQHKLSQLRDASTQPSQFRHLMREIALLMGYEALRDLPTTSRTINTPVAPMDAPFVREERLLLVPILRAGNGLLDGLIELVPAASVGHVGLYRDASTLEAVEYYCKLPDDTDTRTCVLLDPMLATGHTAIAAAELLKANGARQIRLLSVLAAPEGLAALAAAHPDVAIFTAAIDSHLNDHGYIVPGLGDAGDRLYGT